MWVGVSLYIHVLWVISCVLYNHGNLCHTSSLVAALIQKKLYHFLWYSFKHSPLDNTFRYVRRTSLVSCGTSVYRSIENLVVVSYRVTASSFQVPAFCFWLNLEHFDPFCENRSLGVNIEFTLSEIKVWYVVLNLVTWQCSGHIYIVLPFDPAGRLEVIHVQNWHTFETLRTIETDLHPSWSYLGWHSFRAVRAIKR